jgi:hypothetical protein
MASSDVAFTIDDAVGLFDGSGLPMTRRQLVTLIAVLDIRPVGKRQGRRGRPALTYDAAELMRLHGAIAPWLVPPEQRAQAFASHRTPANMQKTCRASGLSSQKDHLLGSGRVWGATRKAWPDAGLLAGVSSPASALPHTRFAARAGAPALAVRPGRYARPPRAPGSEHRARRCPVA